jgi:hypothetical protein
MKNTKYDTNISILDNIKQDTYENKLFNTLKTNKKILVIMSSLDKKTKTNRDIVNIYEKYNNNKYDNVIINWIPNYKHFTTNNTYMFNRYDNYKKYYKIPYEADDYEKPLLNGIH